MLSTFLRVFLAKRLSSFSLRAAEMPCFDSSIKSFGLYVHIPFCRQICPFCPYNKCLYREDKVNEYCQALSLELQIYKNIFDNAVIDSIYIGGGTPTSIASKIVELIGEIKSSFFCRSVIGLEAHPVDINESTMRLLREAGVNMLSVGVQTFNSRLLKTIGRTYDGQTAVRSIQTALSAGFATVDVDLIFALPGQEIDEVADDVATAFALGAHQISTYPLIIFPYTGMDNHIARRGLKKPSLLVEKKMLDVIVDLAQKNGYRRTSIWTFTREGVPRYSSVTRERFVGIGAGAASLNSGYFYLNTFSPDDYVTAVRKGLPISVGMRLSSRVEELFWLYWRMYDMDIPRFRFQELFQDRIERRFGLFLTVLRLSGLAVIEGDSIRLTTRGAYLFHLVEKGHSWDYLCRVWASSIHEAWPAKINF